MRRLAVLLIASALALSALCGQAAAQTYTVTNLGDSGAGSLRGQLEAADSNPGPDTIGFAAGVSGTIPLSGTGLQITDPVTIEGPGASVVTVAQSSANRVVKVALTSPGAVTIGGLHIEGGTAPSTGDHPGYGGDILNDASTAVADLTISGCVISGGQAESDGGGIESIGAPLHLIDSTVLGNHAIESGGVETGGDADFSIEDSTISGNRAEIRDGGLDAAVEGHSGLIEDSTISGNTSKEDVGGADVQAYGGGHVTVANTTVSGNTAEGDGGLGNAGGLLLGTDATGTVSVESSTIASNHALGPAPFGDGGGVLSNPINVSFENTIVAGNSALHGPDVDGPVTGAFDLIGDPSGATAAETVPGSDLLGVDPGLGALTENGGPTETMALTAESPAVDKGQSGLATDQRGLGRPVSYPGIADSAAPGANGADIGAFELQAPPTPPPTTTTPAPSPAKSVPAPPSNHFKIDRLKLNRKRGTAAIVIEVPGPGVLQLKPGPKLKAAAATVKRAGAVTLVIGAKGKASRVLRRRGFVKARAFVQFTPVGGSTATQVEKLRLTENPAADH